jgi:chaperone required for assembly of F1-ATPase
MSEDYSPGDPMRDAQKNMRPTTLRRFYKNVGVVPSASSFALQLDGRGARTPAKKALVFPTLAIAELAASEWMAQGATIVPATMPTTRIANSAIDGVAAAMAETRAELAEYIETDLLYYRAVEPEKLGAAQAEAYDPVLEWADQTFGVRFILALGIIHVAQPERSLRAVRAELDAIDEPFALAALHVMTTLTGSILLALGVLRSALDAAEAWRIAHVDEDFQISQWGEDDEAMVRRAGRWREMAAAAAIAGALGSSPQAGA